MKLPFFIALRYLFSKKKQNIINIISLISIIGVTVVTAALIIVLSVFNGFDRLIKKFYSSFDPDIKIVSVEKKFFVPSQDLLTFLKDNPEIESYSFVLEENAMLKYEDKQIIAVLKGVDKNFQNVSGVGTLIRRGEYKLSHQNISTAVAAWGIAYNLRLDFESFEPVTVYMPSRTKNLPRNIQDTDPNINTLHIYVAGSFETHQEEYDIKYFLLPIEETRKLLEYETEISAIELKLKKNCNTDNFIKNGNKILNGSYLFLDKNMQHESVYKILKSEKLMIFIILLFILLIASFNLIASLSMLIIDKKQDVEILKSMGSNNLIIKNIFFMEGFFINLIGVFSGLFLGTIVCLIQIRFGIISLGYSDSSYIINNYPIAIEPIDYVYIFFSVLSIGLLTSLIPLKLLTRNRNDNNS